MCLADTSLSVALLLGLPAGIFSVSGHSVAVQSLPIVGIVANIVGATERAITSVSCGHFGTVRLKFKPPTYIQQTVGDK